MNETRRKAEKETKLDEIFFLVESLNGSENKNQENYYIFWGEYCFNVWKKMILQDFKMKYKKQEILEFDDNGNAKRPCSFAKQNEKRKNLRIYL